MLTRTLLLLTACDPTACLDAPPTFRSTDCSIHVVTHAWSEYAAGQVARHVGLSDDVWSRHGIAIHHDAEQLDAYVPLLLATEPGCDAFRTFDDRFADDGRVHVLAVLAVDDEDRRFEGWQSSGVIALRLDAQRFTLAHEIGHTLGLWHAPGLMEGEREITSDALTDDQVDRARARACGVGT